jgi:ferredoxin
MRIKVETGQCIGAGNCNALAPQIFGLDDDGIVNLLDASPPAGMESHVREAAQNCPSRSISVVE